MAKKTDTKEKLQNAGDKLSDVLSKAKDGLVAFGDTVATKSKEMIDLAKLNTQRAKLSAEIEENYHAIGQKAYENGKLTGELAEHGKKIRANQTEIKKLDKQIAALEAETPKAAVEKKATEAKTAVKKTGTAVKTAAKKTGAAVKTAAKKTTGK